MASCRLGRDYSFSFFFYQVGLSVPKLNPDRFLGASSLCCLLQFVSWDFLQGSIRGESYMLATFMLCSYNLKSTGYEYLYCVAYPDLCLKVSGCPVCTLSCCVADFT